MIQSVDVPFTNGVYSYDGYTYCYNNELCSKVISDDSSIPVSHSFIESINLSNQMKRYIPDCNMNPLPCTNGQETITMVRTTKSYSGYEYFIIRDASGVIRYKQPSIYENNGYTWSVTLCKATHTIHLYGYTSSSSYYWYSGSSVVLKKGSTVIGTYTSSSKYHTSFTFSV